jgi:hypothetical protein
MNEPLKRENPLYSLLFNVVIPVVIMTRFSKPEALGPTNALLIGIAFPVGYGLYDLLIKKKVNWISILGVVGVGLTGVFGLLSLSGFWFAVKEAAIPLLIGLVVIVTQWTSKPLVKTFLYNDQLLNIPKIEDALDTQDKQTRVAVLLRNASFMLAGSFLLSSLLNFWLANRMVVSAPQTSAYVDEIGSFTGLSYFVIAVPCMVVMMVALFLLINGLSKVTELKWEELMRN